MTESSYPAQRPGSAVCLPSAAEDLRCDLGMSVLLFAALVLCFFIPAGECQQFTIIVERSQINVTDGGNALFSVRPSINISSGNWAFNGKSVGQWIGETVSFSNEYTSRAEIFISNGSLLLKSVITSDSGEYRVIMVPTSGDQISATITLNVIEAITKPTISANKSYPIEHDDTVALLCNTTGSPTSFLWFDPNEVIHSGNRTALNQDNSMLVISGVLRTDEKFVCRVSDGNIEKTSDPYDMNVAYGPEYLRISTSSELTFYPVGSNVTFLCSAISNPAPQFQWIRDHSTLPTSGQQLSIADLSFNHTGNYTCNASNLITQKYAVATRLIVILEPVSKPDITSNITDPVEHNDTVSLTCSARGTDVSYLWFMNNKTVSSGGRITLSSDNSSLTVSGVLRSDEEFTCSGYNMVNKNTSDPYRLNIQYGPENVTIYINPELPAYETGTNANFSCLTVSNPAPEILWYFNGSSLQHNGHRLILVNLSLSDTGIYACEAFNNVTKRSSSTTRNFVVLEPVSSVIVKSNATRWIEYNDTVSLTCFAKGTDVSYLWFEENSPIASGGRFELSADNTTMTIAGVLRTDRCFTCRASNLINNVTSDPFCLDVYYGPDRPTITTNTTAYIAGSTIALKCSADSRPAANLEWHFSGVLLRTEKELILNDISVNETGDYICQAFNNMTERFNASTRKITVLEPISHVKVDINSSVPMENDTVLFTCDAIGTIQRRTWFKDNTLIQNTRIFISPDNANLTITGLLRNDTGKYKCNVSNDFSSNSSEIDLKVNYGPDNITIQPQGPIVRHIAQSLTLECFADSVPTGEYIWHNGTVNVMTEKTYNIPSVRKADSGNYTCQVNNNITKKTISLSVMVDIQERDQTPGKPNSLSGGAIAGIVIGIIVGVALVIGLAFYIIKIKTSRLNTGFGKSDPKGTSPGNIPSSQTEYAEIERKNPSQPKPEPSSNGANTASAQVKDEVIYTRPNIINLSTKPTSDPVIDNKTDYAEVKYR